MKSLQFLENLPNRNSGFYAKGRDEQLGGLESYVNGPSHSEFAIILISDAFGYEDPNLRKLADKMAVAGFWVVVPDLLNRDYFPIGDPKFDKLAWHKAHGKDKGCEDTKTLIVALKSKGVSSIGAAGFGWGGGVVAKLAISSDIEAAVLLDPILTLVEDLDEVRIPIAILGAENSLFFPKEKLKQADQMLSAKAEEFESFVKLYPGVTHGWTLECNEDEVVVKSAEEAHQDMLNWFIKHIKTVITTTFRQAGMTSTQFLENLPERISCVHAIGKVLPLEEHGIKLYFNGPSHPKLAIIFISDAFGYEVPALRKLADKVAAAGFLVAVPDLLNGDYFPIGDSKFDKFAWKETHGGDKEYEDIKLLIATLKYKGNKSIGAAGFGWGVGVVTKLAISGEIEAAVLLYPNLMSDEDLDEIRIPIAILGAEISPFFPPEKLKQAEQMLSAKDDEFESFVKLYPGVTHGWTLESNEDEAVVKSAEEAHQDMLNWFIKHIKEEGTTSPLENLPNRRREGRLLQLGGHGLKFYVNVPAYPKLAIILISDAFGYQVPALRKLADKVATAGFLVVVPDLLNGDYFPIGNPRFDKLAWKEAHGVDKGCEDIKPLIASLKSKGMTSIGAAGFGWGGGVVTRLASSDYIQAAVLLYPSSDEDLDEVKIPIAILGAQFSDFFPPRKLKEAELLLSAKAEEFESFVKLYPGVNHGWTLLNNFDNGFAAKSAEEAHEDMLNWFIKHIK